MEPWLERAAAMRPDRVAIEAPDGRLTYAELLARARDAAPGLRGVVAIDLPPGLEFAVRLHACLLAGAAAMPVDQRLSERERAALTSRAAPGTAVIVHTSGTTGAPQPVSLTPENIQANALGTAAALGVGADERWLCPLPLSHVGGLMVLLRSVIYATTAVLGPADRDDMTLASMVPTQLARVLHRTTHLRAVLLGGAPADRSLLVRARDAGWPVAPTYGLTQACSSVTIGEVGDTRTSGRAIPGVDVAIAADGEILVSGPTVAGGGTLRTGDLGHVDDRGRLVVTGRKTDTIVSGGENVAPAEVEAVLLEHPAVADAGVFARAHPQWGEAVTARVVLRSDASERELRAWAGERLVGFKVPKTIEVADELPRTASGKLLRRELT
jgi:o-succinylbenzoate---CoA ligase